MAAETAVEITAQETALTEDRQAKAEHSEATVQEGRLERAEIVLEEALVKIQREEVSETTVQEEALARTLKEEALVRTPKEEALAEGSQLPAAEVDSTQRRKASTRRISTTSVTRRKAASTR